MFCRGIKFPLAKIIPPKLCNYVNPSLLPCQPHLVPMSDVIWQRSSARTCSVPFSFFQLASSQKGPLIRQGQLTLWPGLQAAAAAQTQPMTDFLLWGGFRWLIVSFHQIQSSSGCGPELSHGENAAVNFPREPLISSRATFLHSQAIVERQQNWSG